MDTNNEKIKVWEIGKLGRCKGRSKSRELIKERKTLEDE